MVHSNTGTTLTLCLGGVVIWALLWAVPAGAEKFSIAVLPDTQYYSASTNVPNTFTQQTTWIRDNRTHGGTAGDPHPIIYVAHLGDLVANNYCDSGGSAGSTEWQRATDAMEILRAAGIPHGVVPGNHDFDEVGAGDPPNGFCQDLADPDDYNGAGPENTGPLFGAGPSGYGAEAYHGGVRPGGGNENNYTLFQSAGGIEFISINLVYSQDALNTVSDWADGLLKQYPDRRAIITAHFILAQGSTCNSADPNFGNFGQELWNELRDNPNLFMMLSGHCRGEKWLRINPGESVAGIADSARSSCMGRVDALMSNYQNYGAPQNNSGNMRIMRFDTVANTLTIDTFSPIGSTVGTPNTSTSPSAMVDGTASDVTITNYKLDPILRPSVVLLQDVSGSMGWAIDGTPGVPPNQQRLGFAQEASKQFLDLMQLAPPDPGIVNIGIAKFGGAASEVFGLEVDTASNILTAKAEIDNLTAGGGTPLVAGVETAENMLNTQTCRAVVLLSDGYHNVPSRATVGDSPITNLLASLDANTRIFSVAFGNTVEVDIPLLKELANETRPSGLALDSQFFDATTSAASAGNATAWSPPTALATVYNKIIGDVLGLQAAVDPFGRIAAGEAQSFPVQVTEHDRQVTFHVSWATPQHQLLSFRVFDSSGNQIPPPGSEFYPGVKIVHGASYQIMAVQKEALRVPGRIGPDPWRLEIINHSKRSKETEPFMYSVLMDSGLKLHAGLDRAGHVVGDTVTLTAELREGRRPILGLTDVTVTVTAPEDGRGNWLSTHAVSPQQLKQIPAQKGAEALAPVVRKGLYLTDIAKVPFPSQKGPRTLRLFDDGSHGDATGADGIYTNRFSDTRKEGTYSFYFQAKGPTHNGNNFRREHQIQAYLSVQPTPETIEINVVRLASDDDKRFDVRVTPKDPHGNFLGPGYSGLITVAVTGGRDSGPLRDNLDGSYTQTVIVPLSTDEQDVQVTVTVGEASTDFGLDEKLDGKLSKPLKSLHAGIVRPFGDLDDITDAGPTVNLDLLYPLNRNLAWDLRLGFSNFDGSDGHSDINLLTVGANLKYTFNPTSPMRVFVNGGGGLYAFDPGDVEGGLNVGIGLNIPLSGRYSFEATYNYHKAVTASDSLHFDQFQLGVLASF